MAWNCPFRTPFIALALFLVLEHLTLLKFVGHGLTMRPRYSCNRHPYLEEEGGEEGGGLHQTMVQTLGGSSVLVMQTSTRGPYQALMDITLPRNLAFAEKMGYDFLSVSGVWMGRKDEEWVGTYNKACMIREQLIRSRHCVVLYLDADVLITDTHWDLIKEQRDQGYPLVMAQRGASFGPWDINAGAMLWNLCSPYAEKVVEDWVTLCENQLSWQAGGDDQSALHRVLRSELGDLVADRDNYTQAYSLSPPLVGELDISSHLIHRIRADPLDWTGGSVRDRAEALRRDVLKIE